LRKNQRIKIVFLIDFIFASTGGTENQLIKILKHLDKEKFNLHLVSLKNTPWLTENSNGLRCSIKTFDYDIFNHKNLKNILVPIHLISHLKKMKPDIVICFFKISYIMGVLSAYIAGVRNIVSTRRDYGLWIDGKSNIFLRIANRFVKGFITNSKNVKELTSCLERLQVDKITVIHNGIEIDQYSPDSYDASAIKEELGITPNRQVVGIVAGLRPMKQHDTFLRAAKNLVQKNLEIDFLIVGDGPRRSELEQISANLELEGHVHFLGWRKKVGEVLFCIDVGVNCSANEGLSNAIMEYMVNGIPCVVSNAGGNSELIKDGYNGFLFDLGDSEQLAEKIHILLINNKLRQLFSHRSKKNIAKNFSLKRMISSYENYFEKIIT
jgi:glycosyltransferase involved in cell wall biosynthesis